MDFQASGDPAAPVTSIHFVRYFGHILEPVTVLAQAEESRFKILEKTRHPSSLLSIVSRMQN